MNTEIAPRGIPGRDTGSGNFGRITSTADPRILLRPKGDFLIGLGNYR
jgi:hypothetical protein